MQKMCFSRKLLTGALALTILFVFAFGFGVNKTIADFKAEEKDEPIKATAAVGAETEYYCRSALSALNNSTALLYAYDQIVAGVEACQTEISVYNGTNAISTDEVEIVLDAYRRDHTEHFWYGTTYQISYDSVTAQTFKPSYLMQGTELSAAKTAFNEAVDEMLQGVTAQTSEFERELLLHDRLAAKVAYIDGENAHNAYGALVEGKAVCEGYAEALQYLLQRAGLQSFIALGSSLNPSTGVSEGHAWNVVKVDGKYYHVDLTWNDQGAYLYHSYFNQTAAVMKEDHVIDDTAYAFPACTSTDAFYFNVKGGRLDSYSVDSVAALLKSNGLKASVYLAQGMDEFIKWYGDNIVAIATKAGVSGRFSYGYARLGKQAIIKISTCAHNWQAATCTAPKTCSVCGDTEGEANGHDFSAWLKDATGHCQKCSVCGERTEFEAHQYGEWITTKAPTTTQTGIREKSCKCGHKVEETIPVSETPSGGGNSGNSASEGNNGSDGSGANESGESFDSASDDPLTAMLESCTASVNVSCVAGALTVAAAIVLFKRKWFV